MEHLKFKLDFAAYNAPTDRLRSSVKHRARSHEHMKVHPSKGNRDHTVHTTTTLTLSTTTFTRSRPHTLENHLTVLNGGTQSDDPISAMPPSHTQSQAHIHAQPSVTPTHTPASLPLPLPPSTHAHPSRTNRRHCQIVPDNTGYYPQTLVRP